MRAKFINEKFEEDSKDPIQDMGIGRVVFEDMYFSIYKDFENIIWDKWVKYVNQFKGKTISGLMDVYTSGEYSAKRKHCEVLVEDIMMSKDGLINVRGEGIKSIVYHLIPTEKYIIKD